MFKRLLLFTLIATSSAGWFFESCVWRPTLACGGGLGCGIDRRVQVGNEVRSKEDAVAFWSELKKNVDIRGSLEPFGAPCLGEDDGFFGRNGKRFCCIAKFEP